MPRPSKNLVLLPLQVLDLVFSKVSFAFEDPFKSHIFDSNVVWSFRSEGFLGPRNGDASVEIHVHVYPRTF